jgi:hypothetical protein
MSSENILTQKGDKVMIKKKLMNIIGCFIAIFFTLPLSVHAISIVEKNQLPAILSFDYSAELLGLEYGVDLIKPDLTVRGTITESGFDWTVSDEYLGNTVAWTSWGIYDKPNDSLHWEGSGSYVGETWSMSGDIEWLSDTEFLVAHQYWIGIPWENGVETDGWDTGTVHMSKLTYEIVRSKTWRHKLFGLEGYVDNVIVTIDDGKITENKLEIHKGKKEVGVSIKNMGGTVTIDGGSFTKTIKVEPIPEPSSLLLLGPGLAGLVWFRKRGNGVIMLNSE